MYCKFCGKEIDNNSKYCPECGKQLNKEPTEIKKQTQPTPKKVVEEEPPTKHPILKTILIFILAIAVAGGIVFGTTRCSSSNTSNDKDSSSLTNNDSNKLLSRNATLNDVNVVWQKNTLAYQGTVIPKNDIENLTITFNFYGDNENQILKTIDKRFGNVQKNKSYDFTISLSEIGYEIALKSNGAKYAVTSGQIKYT